MAIHLHIHFLMSVCSSCIHDPFPLYFIFTVGMSHEIIILKIDIKNPLSPSRPVPDVEVVEQGHPLEERQVELDGEEGCPMAVQVVELWREHRQVELEERER